MRVALVPLVRCPSDSLKAVHSMLVYVRLEEVVAPSFYMLRLLCGCSTTRLRLPIKGFGGSV